MTTRWWAARPESQAAGPLRAVDATDSSLEVVLVDKGVDSVLFELVCMLSVMLDLSRCFEL